MTPAQGQADKNRSQRYHYLKSLGYSAKEAKLWSHRSSERQISNIDERYDRVQATPIRQRTAEQNTFAAKVNRTRNERDSRILTHNQRKANWVKWSDKFGDGFPDHIADEIARLNGNNVHGKFGYRAYYFFYVKGENPSEAEQIASGYAENFGEWGETYDDEEYGT